MGWWDRGMLEEKKSGDDVGLGLGLGDAILQFPPPSTFFYFWFHSQHAHLMFHII